MPGATIAAGSPRARSMSVEAQPRISDGVREARHPGRATRATGRSNDAPRSPRTAGFAQPPKTCPSNCGLAPAAEALPVFADRAHVCLVGLDRLVGILW